MPKYLTIYEEAVSLSHIWLCNRSLLNFHIYEENFLFFFISVGVTFYVQKVVIQAQLHCYPFSSQLVLNLTLALSWVQRGHLLKLCYKEHIRVLHLTVHELAFGGRNREKTEQARTYNLLHHNQVLYHCALWAYIKYSHCVAIFVMFKNKSGTLPEINKCF